MYVWPRRSGKRRRRPGCWMARATIAAAGGEHEALRRAEPGNRAASSTGASRSADAPADAAAPRRASAPSGTAHPLDRGKRRACGAPPCAMHALELGEVVERALREHGPAQVERHRVGAARDILPPPRRPASATSSKVSTARTGSLRSDSTAGSSARQARHPLETNTASASSRRRAGLRSARSAGCRRRPRAPRRGSPARSPARGAGAASPPRGPGRSTASAQPAAGEQRNAEAEPEPLVRARGRSLAARGRRERPPRAARCAPRRCCADRRARAEAGAGRSRRARAAGPPPGPAANERHQARRRVAAPRRRRPRRPRRARARPATSAAPRRPSAAPPACMPNVPRAARLEPGRAELGDRRAHQDQREGQSHDYACHSPGI